MIKLFFPLVLLCLIQIIGAEHPHDDRVVNYRRGRIFTQKFWDGFEKGIDDTFDVISRVRSNLEVAMDQVTDNLETSLYSFADRIDDRVEDSIPQFLRRINRPDVMDQSMKVSSISGDIGGGVDDEIDVVYKDNNSEEVEISFRPHEGSVEEDRLPTFTNIRRPFNIFNGPLFRPFGSNTRNGFFNFFGRQQQWWQGENVCSDREEVDEAEKNTNDQIEAETEVTEEVNAETLEAKSSADEASNKPQQLFPFSFRMDMTTCTDAEDKYTCVTRTNRRGFYKTITVTYRCCHGFVRDGQGCTQVVLRTMSDTLNTLESTTDFLSLIRAANLMGKIETGNRTLFVPTNEAVEEYTLDLEAQNDITYDIDEESNSIYRKKRQIYNLTPTLLGHIIEGFMYLGDMTDETVIPTLNLDSTIRVNVYGNLPNPPVVTINCARIIKANQHSVNGVVHTIDRVLIPVQRSIFDIIESDPQFSILKQLINIAQFSEMLMSDGQLTLFAPTDEAFKKLKPSTLNSLLEGSSCLDAVIKQHILPNTICSAVIQNRKKTINLLEEYLVVSRDELDQMTVEDAKLIETDIIGTNGVIHVIDKALMPNEAKSLSEILESNNLTRFIELVNSADLMEEFNAQKDITVFAPSNEAVERLPEEQLAAIKANKESLKNLLRYHVTIPSIKARNINNNHLAETRAGHLLRINLYSKVPIFSDIFGDLGGRSPVTVTAGCARVSNLDSRACGAVVHVVEKMLEIPEENVVEALKADPNFSLFLQMLQDTGVDEELAEEGPFTVLVPSDHALRTLPQDELEEILNNEELKEKIVRRHIMREHICCSGISSNAFLNDRKRTLDGKTVHIRRSYTGRLMAGPARITNCGFPTGNGVLHTVNRIILQDQDMYNNNNNRRVRPGVKLFDLSRILDIINF